ncbi:thyroid receptor-interacting protein 13 [Cylindrobasidium torrendii FP15055 ss-10]|uniref:Thyroid receptor-interacting protein 13 n=1 Tax=Cylindrobasidium torrendii FP15055 ss-10 TaxID=1314674 RepID=A0A0D7BAU8_9AGAR|nr:thyroid receptor-interacting protein 13 [Cylindrobasidium torrendii FP15055 ss-10]
MDLQQGTGLKYSVHVEVRLYERATKRFETIRAHVEHWIQTFDRINLNSTLTGWDVIPDLAEAVDRIIVAEAACPQQSPSLSELIINVHVYQPTDSESFDEFTNTGKDDEDETSAATVCELPNTRWEGLWESLIYADDIKLKLLDYIHATLVLSDANVDFNLVTWNRVVLLHGPPGTGKTSLCRALAQKLSIRLSHRYTSARLLEINAHSLFSKWFSESGKLVQQLFSNITEMADEEETFIVVLIDEVESLTAARAGAMSGTEPSDGLRVVNALLTQLDKLKHRKNVLIMSTSNLVQAIDSAFVDRADIIQYVDLPSREAIYEILRSSLSEIINKKLISQVTIPTLQAARMYERAPAAPLGILGTHQKSHAVGQALMALAAQCRTNGMSGRALRRLPVLALARYVGVATLAGDGRVDVDAWIAGMDRVVKDLVKEKEHIRTG